MSNESNGFVDQVGRGLGSLFKFLIRLLFVLVLAVALGAGIFYGISVGIPALDRAYIQPVRDNSAAIASLESKATQSAESYAAQIETMQSRITELEVKGDSQAELIALLETELAALSTLPDSQADLESRLEEINTVLEGLDSAITALDSANDERMAAIEESVSEQSDTLEALTTAQETDPYSGETLHSELQVLKIMTLLTRAQVYLAQEDSETATADLESARSIAMALAAEERETGIDLEALILRLDLALGSLPDQPDRAVSDIGAAWEDLLAQLAPAGDEQAEDVESDGPAATPEPTSTPTETP